MTDVEQVLKNTPSRIANPNKDLFIFDEDGKAFGCVFSDYPGAVDLARQFLCVDGFIEVSQKVFLEYEARVTYLSESELITFDNLRRILDAAHGGPHWRQRKYTEDQT